MTILELLDEANQALSNSGAAAKPNKKVLDAVALMCELGTLALIARLFLKGVAYQM
jgi:hypothetical protein